jgi:hypothetical protein
MMMKKKILLGTDNAEPRQCKNKRQYYSPSSSSSSSPSPVPSSSRSISWKWNRLCCLCADVCLFLVCLDDNCQQESMLCRALDCLS